MRCTCGHPDDYNYAIDNGLCNSCIAEKLDQLDKANEIETDLNNSIGFLEEGIAQWKAENERLRDKTQTARQWQTCPNCNRIFATVL